MGCGLPLGFELVYISSDSKNQNIIWYCHKLVAFIFLSSQWTVFHFYVQNEIGLDVRVVHEHGNEYTISFGGKGELRIV